MGSHIEIIFGILVITASANSLICSICQSNILCKWGLVVGRQICDGNPPFSNCYTLLGHTQNGKTIIDRGCISGLVDCSAIARVIAITDPSEIQDLSCTTCASDECNSVGRLWTIVIFVVIILVIPILIGGAVRLYRKRSH